MNVLPPTPENISLAVTALRAGALVGIPTETVYGLAADATNAAAVRKVFEAKGRPAENPLIVHVWTFSAVSSVATSWPEYAEDLAAKFWPGPLTLVLPKRPSLPDEVTGGLDTVAVRCPAHRVALALLRSFSGPLAAPSANCFGSLSPTVATDIEPEILERVELVLDGGPCVHGLESTVLDCTVDTPEVLRPGALDREAIAAFLNRPVAWRAEGVEHKSPGEYVKHYAPQTRLTLVERVPEGRPGLVLRDPDCAEQRKMPADPKHYAAELYAALHELDRLGRSEIYVEVPPDEPAWEAVRDRLTRAASEPS